MPHITVVVPVYNRGEAVCSTLESALGQDLPPDEVEVVVVDDGSTDETWSVLQERYGHNARVRLFSIANVGVAKARNFGLEQARGEFIAYLDHDDLWLPSKLRLQLDPMKKPQVGVVYCSWRDINENDEILGDEIGVTEEASLPAGHVFEKLWRTNFIVSMSVPLIRISLLIRVGGFRPAFVPCDDWDLWLRLSQICDFAVVPETLVSYRIHENQQSVNSPRMARATDRVLKHHLRKNWRFAFTHPRILWHASTLGYFYKTKEDYDEAKEAITQANWKRVGATLLGCLRRFPFLLLSPQWIYVLKRLATRDSRPF